MALKLIGKCKQCGRCCQYRNDFAYYANNKGEDIDSKMHWGPFRRCRKKVNDYNKNAEQEHCKAFDPATHNCEHHGTPDKPLTCSGWPFFPEELVMVGCPGFTCVSPYSTGLPQRNRNT